MVRTPTKEEFCQLQQELQVTQAYLGAEKEWKRGMEKRESTLRLEIEELHDKLDSGVVPKGKYEQMKTKLESSVDMFSSLVDELEEQLADAEEWNQRKDDEIEDLKLKIGRSDSELLGLQEKEIAALRCISPHSTLF